jgi:hypothetical protein
MNTFRDLSIWELLGLIAAAVAGLFYLIESLWEKLPPHDPPHDSGGGHSLQG